MKKFIVLNFILIRFTTVNLFQIPHAQSNGKKILKPKKSTNLMILQLLLTHSVMSQCYV